MTKRILLVCHGHPFETIGGVGQVVEQLTTHLPKQGWEVHVLVPSTHKWLASISITSNIETWGILHKLHRPIRRWSQSWKDEKTNDRLFEWIRDLNPSVIHIHHLNELPWEWLLQGKQILRYHLWLTLHDYAIPCARGQLLNQHLQLCDGPNDSRCTDCIRPWLALDGWKRQGMGMIHQPNLSIAARNDLTVRLLSAIDHIDAPSQHLIEHFRHIYPSIQIQHCTLPMPAIEESQHTHTTSDIHHRFLFVGSIHPSKGLHILLRAFVLLRQRRSNVRLSIIGHDSPSDVVSNYGQIWKDFTTTVSNIDWIGTVSHQEVLKQMNQHQTLVLPSLWRENSPIVVREALQRGMHVICGEGGSYELSPAIIQVKPISVNALMTRMNEVVGQPLPSRQTYPLPENTISEWVQSALASV